MVLLAEVCWCSFWFWVLLREVNTQLPPARVLVRPCLTMDDVFLSTRPCYNVRSGLYCKYVSIGEGGAEALYETKTQRVVPESRFGGEI